MLLSCAVAQLAIAPRIDAVRSSIPGAVESLAADDPRRVLFGRLHAVSVGWLGARDARGPDLDCCPRDPRAEVSAEASQIVKPVLIRASGLPHNDHNVVQDKN